MRIDNSTVRNQLCQTFSPPLFSPLCLAVVGTTTEWFDYLRHLRRFLPAVGGIDNRQSRIINPFCLFPAKRLSCLQGQKIDFEYPVQNAECPEHRRRQELFSARPLQLLNKNMNTRPGQLLGSLTIHNGVKQKQVHLH